MAHAKVEGAKYCPGQLCNMYRPLETFGPNRSTKDGKADLCRNCMRERQRGRKYKAWRPGLYEKLFTAQRGACAVCGWVPPAGQILVIDHCHATGKIRGLLCKRCNIVLGRCEDNPDLLRKLAMYLEAQTSSTETATTTDFPKIPTIQNL